MTSSFKAAAPLRRLLAMAAAGMLTACGGSGSVDGSRGAEFQGVVATGAPVVGADVTVTDRTGRTACTATTGSDGRYACTLAEGAQAPFALSARHEDTLLYSVAASATDATVNLTPLTSLIVARLVPDGDPASLASALQADPSLVSEQVLAQKVDEVRAVLAPVLEAVGDATDPLNGTFAADGSGHDRLLDALQVSIRPTGEASNIEITVKTRPTSDDTPPVQIAFTSDAAQPPAVSAQVRAGDLVTPGVAGAVQGLLGRLTACYAEPLHQRIAGTEVGAEQAAGAAADVLAPSCRGLFWDDNPENYLDGGLRVGSGGAFQGLFRASSTGVRYDRGVFEYQRANGDLLISLRSTATSGSVQNLTLFVRPQGQLLKIVGDGHAYRATVRPTAALRDFIAQPQFTWFGTGIDISIANRTDPNTGLSLFREARVTAPDGRISIYRPLPGRSAMGVVAADGRQRVNQVQFLASGYADPATAGEPASRDGASGAFFVEPQLDEAALRALPDHGVWQIEWLHADPSVPNVVQSYRTISRPYTLAEVKQVRFADLTDAFRAELLAARDPVRGRWSFGAPDAAASNHFRLGTADGGPAWTVPDGAEAPVSLTIYGAGTPSGAYNDTVGVSTLARSATIVCSAETVLDTHCDSALTSQYAPGVWWDAMSIFALNGRQMAFARQVNLYLQE